MKRFIIIIFGVCLWACDFNNPSSSRRNYTSEHFIISYDESLYSSYEVELFAEKKERILAHVNKRLDVNFQDIIITSLNSERSGAQASYSIHTYESHGYILRDSGHEIVHIVSFQEIGIPLVPFLQEGLAVAYEIDNAYYNKIEEFFDLHNWLINNIYYGQDADTTQSSIKEQFIDGTFNFSSYSYALAGAFVTHLVQTYGLDKFKELYRRAAPGSNYLDNLFMNIYEISVDSAEVQFINRYAAQKL